VLDNFNKTRHIQRRYGRDLTKPKEISINITENNGDLNDKIHLTFTICKESLDRDDPHRDQ
jgi:hypothetical protein